MGEKRKTRTFAKHLGVISTAALSTFALSEALSTAKAAEIESYDAETEITEQFVEIDEVSEPATIEDIAEVEESATTATEDDEIVPIDELTEADLTPALYTSGDDRSAETVATETDEVLPIEELSEADLTPTLYGSGVEVAEEETYEIEVSESERLYEAGKNDEKNEDGVYSYRIPALLRTKDGSLLAASDQRVDHSGDWGDINIVVRRSTDNGETWDEIKPIIDLPTNPNSAKPGEIDSAFTIDSALVQDPETGRIFVFYGMMPEIRGIWELDTESKAYSEIDGVTYQNLFKEGEEEPYTIREEGIVYSPANEPTDYRVVTEAEAPYSELGDLYEKDQKIGNVYFTTNDASPFKIVRLNYLWMSYSDDDGQTWAQPTDITPQVREDWMQFFGVGPGAGIALHTGEHKGRLIIPMYSTNKKTGAHHLNGAQASRVIYSDDHGKTWHGGEAANDGRIYGVNKEVISAETQDSPSIENSEATVVQLNNGDLKMFMRNRSGYVTMATSKDGGETWEDQVKTIREVKDVYVQLAAVQTMIEGQEYVVLVNAGGPGRTNGTIHLALVLPDGELEWVHHQKFQDGKYAYNSIAPIGDGQFGILYEHSTEEENDFNLDFRTINITTPHREAYETITIVKDAAADAIADLHFDKETEDAFFDRIDKAGSYDELDALVKEAIALSEEMTAEWSDDIAPEFGDSADVLEQWIDREDDDVEYTEEWVDFDAPEAALDADGHVVSPEKPVADVLAAEKEKADAATEEKAATPAEGATAALPHTGFAAAGLGLAVALVGVGSAFTLKKKH